MAGIRLRPKRRTGSAGWPTPTTLLEGEIVVNAFEGKIGMRVGANIVEIANNASAGSIPWSNVTNKGEVWVNNMTGNRDFSNGAIRARGNNARIMVFDNLLDVPDVELGAGWNDGTDGIGYIVNRREQFPLRLAGRNASMYLGLGEGDRMSILHNSALQLTSNAFVANATYGVQNVALSMRWNGNPIWQIGSENNGDFHIWSYTDTGAYLGVRLQMKGDGRVAFGGTAIGADHYSALGTFGGIKSRGFASALGFDDRSSGAEWNWYANGGTARLWFSGTGDLVYVDGSGLRATAGLNQGTTDAGWNLRWNAIAPGVGASEYINNRQGGSGGHIFATRQNEGQVSQQHHHLLSNGRMNIRTANGNWQQQPRIFSGGGDPGAAAEPGDLWFQEV